MAFDPFARAEDDGADDGGYESDGPLGSGAQFVSKALTPHEQAAMQVRGSGPAEVETAPVAAHLKNQGPGLKLENTLLHSFGKEPGKESLCAQMSEDGHMAAVGCRDGRVRIVSARPGTGLMHTLGDDFPGVKLASCTALRWRPEAWHASETKNVLLVARDSEILHYHATSGRVMSIIQEADNQIYALGTCPLKPMFASAGVDRNLRVYDEGKQAVAATLASGGGGGVTQESHTGHSNSIYAVRWMPEDPHVLLSGGWDNTVQIWDCRTGAAERSIFGPYICGDALDMSGGTILTGSWRNQTPLQLWDYGTGRLMTNLPIHQPEPDSCFLYSAQFGVDAHSSLVLAGGSGCHPGVHVMKKSGQVVGFSATSSSVHAIHAVATIGGLSVAACCAEELLLMTIA